ncbi:MAG: L-seryl-tRNA(Sec) selenium transferase [Nitrospinae bacterium]|nr:L-seryl-tRNA(Sec) selenium transferase [Nitrospinota bacterium]
MENETLRKLPSVDSLLSHSSSTTIVAEYGRDRVVSAIRREIDSARRLLLKDKSAPIPGSEGEWIALASAKLAESARPKLMKVINCAGVVTHTNLGRSIISEEAARAAHNAAISNVNLEYDLAKGARGDRDDLVEGLICELTGAESATVVNNNAAAVLLALNTLAFGKEAIVSRGELIEIGGSFRLPDIMAKSGCVLREVGTTNRTHLYDYENAVSGNVAIILRAHTSNYRIIGFTTQPKDSELAEFARSKGLPFMVDLGSGAVADITRFGLPYEQTIGDTLRSGVDLVTVSGDKLLGGPQAGIIAGRRDLVTLIKKNHLKRALRCCKMTLAALEATLLLYLNPEKAARSIPTLRLLARSLDNVRATAEEAARIISRMFGQEAEVSVIADTCQAGSGAMPELDMPSYSVAIRHKKMSADGLAKWFRGRGIPVIGRVKDDLFRLDMRTVETLEWLEE